MWRCARSKASARLATTSGAVKSQWLRRSAAMLRESVERIEEANEQDLAAAPGFGLTDAEVDRLRLTPARIEAMAVGLEEIAALPEPIGEVIQSTIRPNGLRDRQGPRAAGRRVFHLRIAAERDGRRGGDLREERQRGDPARRQRSGPFEPGDCRTAGGGGRPKSACRPMPCNW